MSSQMVMSSKELMFNKGIDRYAFIDNENFAIIFYASGSNSISCCNYQPMCKGNFQIDILNNNGNFSWEVTHKEQVLVKRSAEIKKCKGNLLLSDLSNMMLTPSIITSEYALSYGFYDCGTRVIDFHLTNHDRSYVYLTKNYSEWMKDLASEEPKFLERPLNVLALPGAHDAGMFEVFNPKPLFKSEDFLNRLSLHLNDSLVYKSMNFSDITGHLERIVINLACTQKDDIKTMLNLGIRYFDFRPGYCYGHLKHTPEFKDQILHQHGFVPGYSYYDFLCDILKWLAGHNKEIVVVNLNFQGFDETSMKPNADYLMRLISNAQSATNTLDIAIGDKTDLSVMIKQLIDENKRLIFLNQIEANSDTHKYEANKYDSYDCNKDKYATTNVNSILTVLDKMDPLLPEGKDYTVLQFQGTATADLIACSTSIFDAVGRFSSDTMSPLMSTKADFDNSTYPWLVNNIPNKFSSNNLLVFINDFVDNAMVKHAIDVTRMRIDRWPNVLDDEERSESRTVSTQTNLREIIMEKASISEDQIKMLEQLSKAGIGPIDKDISIPIKNGTGTYEYSTKAIPLTITGYGMITVPDEGSWHIVVKDCNDIIVDKQGITKNQQISFSYKTGFKVNLSVTATWSEIKDTTLSMHIHVK